MISRSDRLIFRDYWTLFPHSEMPSNVMHTTMTKESVAFSPCGHNEQRLVAARSELVERLNRAVPLDGTAELLEGLRLRRASALTSLEHGVSSIAFCVIAEGSKEILLGDRRFTYDSDHYLITTAALPVASRIIEATPDRPFLSVLLPLDPALIGSAMTEVEHPAPPKQQSMTAIDVGVLDPELLDAVLRLVRLIDAPDLARILAPMVVREIVFRLLMGEQAGRLRQLAATAGATSQITQAIVRIRREFDRPMRMDELAQELGMSTSAFHYHFKQVTAMSPLQFQKQLRLQEARRLMLGEGYDAATAGYRVGYDDASYFNREYKRFFGEPPMRDVIRLRETAFANTDF